MTFLVGQKVVCVDTKSPVIIWRGSAPSGIREGSIYTVSRVSISPHTNRPALQLYELPTQNEIGDCWYQAMRFRPIVERKTDISIFTAMLKTERQPLLTEQ